MSPHSPTTRQWRRPQASGARYQGHALIEALGALALLGLVAAHSLPMPHAWAARLSLVQARARFEADWQAARWQAQRLGSALRLQALPGCHTAVGPGGWHCGWQVVIEANGQLLHESHLPAGVWVTPKPADGWRVDAWGEPLGGGASVGFQSSASAATTPEWLCLNVLGRLRRVQGDACSN